MSTAEADAQSNIVRRMMLGSSWSLLGRLVNLGSNLVISVLLARTLSQAEFGGYVLGYWLVQVLGNFSLLGGNQIIVRSLAKAMGTGEAEVGRTIVNALCLAVAGCVLASVIILLFGPSILRELAQSGKSGVLKLFAFWVLNFGFQLLFGEIFRGLGSIGLASLFAGALGNSLIMAGAGVILFAHLPVSLAGIIAMCGICLFASNGLAAAVLWRHTGRGVFGPPKELTGFARGAFTLMIMFFGGFVTQQIDLWALSQFHPHAEAALYGAASRLALLAGLPKLIIEGSIPPLVASLVLRSDRDGLRSLVQTSATISTIPALLYFLLALFAGPLVLRLVYGAPYSGAWPILAILGAGQLFFTMVGSPTIVLVMAHRQWDVLATLVLAGVASLAMTWLASRYGSPVDVAIASALGMVVQGVALIAAARARLGIFTNVTPAGFKAVLSMIGLGRAEA